MVNAKYAAEFKEKGFVFLAISPGFVKTWDDKSESLCTLPVAVAIAYDKQRCPAGVRQTGRRNGAGPQESC